MKRSCILFSQTLLLLFALLGATQLASAASDTWVGNTDNTWGTAANWSPAVTPVAGDSLSFGAAGISGAILNNTLTAGTAFSGLTFSSGGSAFTLNGFGILLSGSISNNIGFANSSGLAQVIGTMPLTLDRGYYTFSSSSPGTLALNGGLTLNASGVAYFDLNVTSAALALDGSGLITGLQGAGLIYNGSKPTGLATINGSGVILAYSGYTTVATGNAIPNGPGVNYEFNTAGVIGTYSTGGAISVNTIRSIQTGNSGGTLTDTLTLGGTLTFGDKGGVYVLDAVAGNKQCLVINPAGQHVTAGTSAGAELIFGVNGTTSGNQLTVNSVIADNSGGAVSVVTVGSGSLVFNPANTYSGGTYVNQ